MARPKQLPPDHPSHPLPDRNGYRCRWVDKEGLEHLCQGQDDWFIWLFMAGRGCGKTLSGANWIIEQALTYPGTRWAVVAPTYDQVQNVCFAAVDSGIRAQAQPGEIVDYNKNNMLLTMSNGSEIKGFSAENPERVRGYNLAGAWLDEVGSYRYRSIWDEVLQPALRKGDPKVIVTTTPSASPLLKEWYQRWLEHAKRGETCDIHLTAAIFKENDTLPPRRVAELERQYGGTRIGRQELEGEMLEDFEGALWRREFIEQYRVRESEFFHSNGKLKTELFSRIVVAVDPSMTSGERSDESGIIIAGQGVDNEAYIIADWSVNGTPEAVMARAVAAYYEFYADCVVMEANQGGDYLTKALRTADPNVPPRIVRASKGKLIRAQPVSMLAEQGRLHHIGTFQKLEDQLCMMTPETDRLRHDDRADAMIWAISELRGITDGSWSEAYGWVYCNSCGHGFRRSYRKCPKCAHEIDPGSEAAVKRPGSWAAAYMNSCKKCGATFPARERECPDCNPTAAGYMGRVGQMTGRSNWLSYQQKNWLSGRKF